MKKLISTIKVSLLFAGLTANFVLNAQNNRICGTSDPTILEVESLNSCVNLDNYIPNSGSPVLTVNIAIYALNLPDGSGELNNFADTTFQNWIANINHIYANNTMPTAPLSGVAFIPDTKIQFNLVGIFHPNVQIFDDQANPGASYALPTLLPNAISIILSPGPTGNGVFWGYGLGQIGGNIASITLDSADIFINNHSMSRRNELGAHELGHVLSLYHTSGSMAGICNITLNEPAVINDIYHPDYMFGPSSVYDSVFCIFNSTRYFCNMGPIPNNVMGYSKEVYFSPRQMAKMRRNIITKKQIFLQTPTEAPYCNTYYSDSAIVISQDELIPAYMFYPAI